MGASVTMLASELLVNGIDRLTAIRRELLAWLEEHEYVSVAQLRGSMSQRAVAFPSAFERAHYLRLVGNPTPEITGGEIGVPGGRQCSAVAGGLTRAGGARRRAIRGQRAAV